MIAVRNSGTGPKIHKRIRRAGDLRGGGRRVAGRRLGGQLGLPLGHLRQGAPR